jgi:hypothetical protein
MGHAMIARTALLLAFTASLAAAATGAALAQTKQDNARAWGEAVDLKPLVIPPFQPFLPPNAVITPGPASGSHVQTPLFDPTRDQATPGLRLTIPSR